MKRVLIWILFLPLQICLLLLFSLTDLLAWSIRTLRSSPSRPRALSGRDCSIVVLNWNGRHLLEESLPPLVREAEEHPGSHEIIVADNGSTDDSVSWLRENFPRVRCLELPQNLGFGEGNNRGVAAARREIVVLLNNDMIVEPGFLDPLLEGFSSTDIFAVSSQVFFPPGRRREETGNTRIRFEKGYPHLSHEPVTKAHQTRRYLPVVWAGGGSSAFRKDLFLQLGGFSSLFSPCYLEDTDLSYRAWRRGWRVVFTPESRVLHKHRSSSSSRFSAAALQSLVEQRRLWYLWKNYQWRSLLGHFLLFPLNLTHWLGPLDYLRALARVHRVLSSRLREPKRLVSDRQLFDWTRHPLTYLNHFYPDRVPEEGSSERLKILIVSAYLPHLGTHGGAGRVYQLLRRVAEGHDVSLVTFIEGPQDEAFLSQAQSVCRRVEAVPRRRFERISCYPYEPFEEFNSPELRAKLQTILTEEDFDLVHYEWTQMALFRDLVPASIPQLITEIEVNYAAHRTLLDVETNPLKKVRLYYNTLQTLYREVEACRSVNQIVCVTGEDAGYLEGYVPPERLAVVNTGVDTGYFHYNLGGSEPGALLFVGAFRHSPNLDAMRFFSREIFPRIVAEEPSVHLYIVGSSPPPEVEELGSHPNITVTGFVEDIRDYYRKAQVVVVPLRTGVGIRGKILEGWSAGRAMVATPLACQGIRALHGENIMIARKAEEFALWTLALLRNPEHCSRLGRAGRQTVEQHYEWDRLGEQMRGVYEELVHSTRRGRRG